MFESSTLILMAKIALLSPFLASVELPVVIPIEVERECCGVKKTMDALMIQKAQKESRIQVLAIKNHKVVSRLQADFSLGKGEAEAIALAMKEKAQLLGIDDKNGDASLGKAAQVAGLSVGQMLTLLAEFGVESRIEMDDYREGLKNLAQAW